MIKEQLNGNSGSILSEAMATENLTFLYLAQSGCSQCTVTTQNFKGQFTPTLAFSQFALFFFLWTGVFDSTVPGNLSILDNPDFS